MFPGYLQDFSRMFSGCSDGSYWPGGIWWSFQMKVRTLKIQRNPMIPNYLMIPAGAIQLSPAIRWSQAIRWSPVIRWSIESMDFDNPKVYEDTFISDGLVFFVVINIVSATPCPPSCWHLWLSKRVLRGLAWGGWFVGKWCQLSLLSAGWGNCLIRPCCCNHRVIITVSSRLKKIVNTTTPPVVWRETAQQLTKKNIISYS